MVGNFCIWYGGTCFSSLTEKVQKQPPEVFSKKTCSWKFRFRPATLFKKRLWHRCFHVNFAKLLRTPILQNNSEQLLQKVEQMDRHWDSRSTEVENSQKLSKIKSSYSLMLLEMSREINGKFSAKHSYF